MASESQFVCMSMLLNIIPCLDDYYIKINSHYLTTTCHNLRNYGKIRWILKLNVFATFKAFYIIVCAKESWDIFLHKSKVFYTRTSFLLPFDIKAILFQKRSRSKCDEWGASKNQSLPRNSCKSDHLIYTYLWADFDFYHPPFKRILIIFIELSILTHVQII